MSSLRLALKQSLEEAAPPIQTKVQPKQAQSKNDDRKRKRKLTKDGRSDPRGRDSKKRKKKVTSIDLMRKINSSTSAASLGTDSQGRKGGRGARSYLSGQSSSDDSDSSNDGTSDSSSSSSSTSSSDDESSKVENSKSQSESDSSSSESSSGSEDHDNNSGSDGEGDRANDDMEGVFDSERTSEEDDSPSSRKQSKGSRRHYRNHHDKYSEDSDEEEESTQLTPNSFQRTKIEKKHSKGHSSSSPVSIHSRSRQQSPVPNESQSYHKHLSSTSSASHKRSVQSSGQSIASSSSKKEKRSTSSISSSKKKEKISLKTNKKTARKQKTVPAPNPHVLAWVMGMSVEKQRRKISPGMRVKVRFVNPSLQWYGGVITAVSSKGDRVKIKYDDGTKEKAKFPDKEIIVDADGNGEHSSDVQVLVQSFRPKVVVGMPHGTVPLSIKKKKLKTKGVGASDMGQKKVKDETSGNRQDTIDVDTTLPNKALLSSSKVDSVEYKKEQTIASVSKVKADDKLPTNIAQSSNVNEKVIAAHVPHDSDFSSSSPVKGSPSKSLSEKPDVVYKELESRTTDEKELVHNKSYDEINNNSRSEEMAMNVSKSNDFAKHDVAPNVRSITLTKKPSPVKESPKLTFTNAMIETHPKDEEVSSAIQPNSSNVETDEKSPSVIKPSLQVSASFEAGSGSKPINAVLDRPQLSVSQIVSSEAMISPTKKTDDVITEETKDNDAISEEDGSQKKSAGRGRKAANRKAQTKPNTKDDRIDGETKIKKRQKDKDDDKKSKGDKKEDVEDWVQCDICSKWRLIPSVKDLPEKWYCELNVTDPKRSFCSAPEQTPEEVARERRKAKKALRKAVAASARSISPAAGVPKKSTSLPKIRDDLDDATEKKRSSPNLSLGKSISEDSIDNIDSAVKKRKNKSDVSLEEDNNIDNDASNQNRQKKRGRPSNEEKAAEGRSKRGRKPKEEKQQEWVQCEKCEKWRRLPRHISAKDLPDQWYCSMNDWDPRSASCAVQEDYKLEEEKIKENTILTNNSQGGSAGGSKLTYRNLIRRPTRPISERMRAAESIFSSHAAEVDGEQSGNPPVVLYANSSMFHQRQPYHTNRPTANLTEGQHLASSMSLFELMSHSQLWKTLYHDCHPTQSNHQDTDGTSHSQSNTTNKSHAEEIKAMIYHAMGNRELSTSDLLLECQCSYWERNEWVSLRATVTHDDIVTALNGLIKDGLVEEVTSTLQNDNDDTLMMDTFSPTRYKRCQPVVPVVVKNKSYQESLKSRFGSRQMKFSKPWKKVGQC